MTTYSEYQLGYYIESLLEFYDASVDTAIPVAYSRSSTEIESSWDPKSVTTKASNSFDGYNTRKKNTMFTSESFVGENYEKLSKNITMSLWLYDLYYGVQPWTLGINRGMFIYEDEPVMKGTTSLVKAQADTQWDIIVSGTEGPEFEFLYYAKFTGRLIQRIVVQCIVSKSSDLYNYWADLSTFVNRYSGDDSFFHLTYFKNLLVYRVTTYIYPEPTNYLSHYEIASEVIWNVTTTFLPNPRYKKSRLIQSPPRYLGYVSAMDTGSWTNYPLGESPEDFVARKLMIPYNNKYATTQAGAGLVQILDAVRRDMEINYRNDEANAGINYSDIRSLYHAVQGYFGVMASDICSAYQLPPAYNRLFQAKLNRQFFMNQHWPGVMDSAVLRAMTFVKEDYSINDTDVNLLGYLKKYWSYEGAEGAFFTTSSGENILRLGAAAADVQRILDELRQAKLDFLWREELKEFNLLMDQSKFSGSFELLDKAITPQPGVELTAYVGKVNTKVLITGYDINIDAEGNFTTNVQFIKRLSS
jgi:hypothetical protein